MKIDKLIVKFIWRGERPWISNAAPKEKKNAGGLTAPRVQDYSNHGSVVLVQETSRSTEQNEASRSRLASVWATGPDKGAKVIRQSKESLFSKWHGSNWITLEEKVTLDRIYTLHRSYSKWIINQMVKWKTIKLLWDNIEECWVTVGVATTFRIQRWWHSPHENNWEARLNYNWKFLLRERQGQEREKTNHRLGEYISGDTPDKESLSKIHKDS